MNFANIYRENLSKLIEDETKKIYTEDQENNVFGLLIDAIKTVRFKNGLDMDGIVKKPLSLDDNDTELAEVLVVWKDLLVKNGVAEPEALSIANRENLKNKENVIKIVRACGAKEEKEPMLSLILNSFGVTGNLRVYYVEEYSKALLKAQKASADSKQKIKEAFRNVYLKKRETISNEKAGKVLDELTERFDDLILNMKELDYISSAGLRLLKRAYMAMRRKNGSLKLKNVNKMVMEVFEVTGFAGLLQFI
jgi:anti-sigma B factor antagonist